MKVLAWGLTDVGRIRTHNEDSFLMNQELALFAVADGMGGHVGGDRASGLAVETLERELGKPETRATVRIGPDNDDSVARRLKRAIRVASRSIHDVARTDKNLEGMGTTLTALLLQNDRAYLAQVGDSRAYLFRDNNIKQLTKDHSWIEEQVSAGLMTRAEANGSSLKHVVTRSVGFERDVAVDISSVPISVGDCFLLCSDGLSNHLGEKELIDILNKGFYSQVPRMLVDAANKKGGEDNITVVLVCLANDSDSVDVSLSHNRGGQ
ncbi:MAG: Stp1/IreP family PP2C-type Ser/Thr phosphatase [Pseudomonadota bacterium]